MSTTDKCCSIAPYFKVKPDQMATFKKFCDCFIELAMTESGCLYYGFTFDGDMVHCREGYTDAEAALVHLKNVGPTLEEAAKISELVRLEIHGPEEELAKLREPLKNLKAQFFVLECGFRR